MEKLIGDVLLGQFRVDALIALGGMKTVYRVWDLKRSMPLVMKVLHPELSTDPMILRRFQREANALKKLSYPHIVPFYGLYQSSEYAFLLEGFIDGPSLKDIFYRLRWRSLPVMEVLAYLKALCSALGFCHANGVVHGNLIPSNIMVDQGGTVYLTDFFSVWHAESTLKALWMPGNPAYMAPEQILGQPVSPATDIYGLGWLSYEMLAGRWPFNGQEPTPGKEFGTHIERMRYACLNLLPPNPRQFNRDISAELASVFLRSLAKDPRERFLSCPEFLASACHAAGTDPDLVPDRVALVGPNAKNAVK